jgi:TatD DNase family protein
MKLIPKTTDFIDIHSHHAEAEEGVFRIYNVFASDFPKFSSDRPISVGLHPWNLTVETSHDLSLILDGETSHDLSLQNILAVGEAGLDRIIQTPMDIQIKAFRTQIDLSIEYKKPLIIHCVKAFPELSELRKEYRNATPWIIHGFNANQTIAAECVKMGIYISLSSRLFRNPEKTAQIAKVIPVSMIFAETDDDIVPIHEIYQTISGLYNLSLQKIKETILENFSRVFMIS